MINQQRVSKKENVLIIVMKIIIGEIVHIDNGVSFCIIHLHSI